MVNWHALFNGNEKVVYLGQMLHRLETVGVTLPRAAYWDDEQISKGLNPSFQRILSPSGVKHCGTQDAIHAAERNHSYDASRVELKLNSLGRSQLPRTSALPPLYVTHEEDCCGMLDDDMHTVAIGSVSYKGRIWNPILAALEDGSTADLFEKKIRRHKCQVNCDERD